ncbi:MAG TPA: TlpA disulfide reductase family protein [Chloroflexota bacterium]|nr:TlpA disulfide reductase family protein [Chloroflexota bacterium]
MARAGIGLVVLAALIVGGAWWYANRAPASPVIGRQAPNFQLPLLNGQTLSLSAERGHPVLVNIWATWCVPCKKEMPELQAASKATPSLVVLGVDNAESGVQVRPYVTRMGITFPILLDLDATVVQQYHVIGTPSSFFIDRGGTLRAIALGAMDQPTLARDLASIGVTSAG